MPQLFRGEAGDAAVNLLDGHIHVGLDRAVAEADCGVGEDQRTNGQLRQGRGRGGRARNCGRGLVGGRDAGRGEAQGVEDVDGLVGFDHQPRIGVVQEDFADDDGLRIEVGVNAAEPERFPGHQILGHHAVHGVEIVEAGVAMKRHLRQPVRRGAQVDRAVQAELAAEDE